MYKFQRTRKCNEFSQAYYWGPHGFWGSGENGYLFSGSWEALVIIFRDSGSKLIVLGIKGALQKSKKFNLNNLTLKEKPSFHLIFKRNLRLLGGTPQTPLAKSQCIYFRVNMLIGLG